MRILKKAGFALLALIILIFVIAIFVDGKIEIERSVEINAPVSHVWQYCQSIQSINTWNAWFINEPNMQTKMRGAEGHPGTQYCWKGTNFKAGEGCLTITKVVPNKLIELNMHFYIPYKTFAKGAIKLNPKGDRTIATISFWGKRPYPFSIMKVFGVVENIINNNFDSSLQNLKKISESY